MVISSLQERKPASMQGESESGPARQKEQPGRAPENEALWQLSFMLCWWCPCTCLCSVWVLCGNQDQNTPPPPPPAACLFPCPCTCWPLLAMAAWNLASGSWWFQVSRPVTLLSRRGVRLSSCIRQPPADAGGLSRRAPLSQAPELHLLIGIEIRNQFRIQSEPLRHSPAHLA